LSKSDIPKIAIRKGKIITRDQLFENKRKFHKEQAKLPFEEKIRILKELQSIARIIKESRKNTIDLNDLL